MREREHDSPHLNLTKCTNCRGRGSDSSSGSTWARALSHFAARSLSVSASLSLSRLHSCSLSLCSCKQTRLQLKQVFALPFASRGRLRFVLVFSRGEASFVYSCDVTVLTLPIGSSDVTTTTTTQQQQLALRCVVTLTRCCGEFRKYGTKDLGNELDSAWLDWTKTETLSKQKKNLLILNFVLKALSLSANCCSFAKPHICLALKSA